MTPEFYLLIAVWAAPLAGSKWICVYDGDTDTGNPQPGFVLWFYADDMRATR